MTNRPRESCGEDGAGFTMKRPAMTQSPATFPECEGGIMVRPEGSLVDVMGRGHWEVPLLLTEARRGLWGLASEGEKLKTLGTCFHDLAEC